MKIYTHNFSPGMKITVDKMKILGITIPTNGKYEDLIEYVISQFYNNLPRAFK
jgi:hypothetical protein